MYQESTVFATGDTIGQRNGLGAVVHSTTENSAAHLVDGELLNSYRSMVRLNQQLNQDYRMLTALHQLNIRLGQSADMAQVMHDALHGVVSLLRAQEGILVLFNSASRQPFLWGASHDYLALASAAEATNLLHNTTVEQALETAAPLVCNDHHHDANSRLPNTRSLLLLPFTTTTDLAGLIILGHARPRSFAGLPADLLTMVSETISLALHNAWQQHQLHEADRNRDHMISLIVHDVRSPLMATSASFDVIQRLMKNHVQDDSTRNFLQESINSGRRALKVALELTNDLLDIKKLQAGRQHLDIQTIPLEVLYDDIQKLFHNMAIEKKVILRTRVHPRALTTQADTPLLRRALVNLVANAMRFSPEGGTILLNATPAPEGNGVLLCVEDMGQGIPLDQRERIFQPFIQGSAKSTHGTGLGLALCREVTLAHNGQIWVEDRPGGGSRFCIHLPTAITGETTALD